MHGMVISLMDTCHMHLQISEFWSPRHAPEGAWRVILLITRCQSRALICASTVLVTPFWMFLNVSYTINNLRAPSHLQRDVLWQGQSHKMNIFLYFTDIYTVFDLSMIYLASLDQIVTIILLGSNLFEFVGWPYFQSNFLILFLTTQWLGVHVRIP